MSDGSERFGNSTIRPDCTRRIIPRGARTAAGKRLGEGVAGRLIGRSVNWRFAIAAAAESSDRSKQSINRARLIRPDKAPGLLFRCKQLMIRPRIAIIARAAIAGL